MQHPNGSPAPVPAVVISYREMPNGMRAATSVEIGGHKLAGILNVRTEARGNGQGAAPIVCVLETSWPVTWQEEGKPEILVARRVP
jgi:hypothetical protein